MSNYIKVTNKAAFIGLFLVGYDLNGQHVEVRSGNFPVLQSASIEIPDGATKITFAAFMYQDFSGPVFLTRDAFATPETACYDLYGTIFNPSCQRVQCPTIGGGNPDLPNCKPCCCCCCNCCCKGNSSYMC